MTDNVPDVRWMSYVEAAQALGVNPESVARRMRRDGWARGRGNDGKPRVAVPVKLLSVPDGIPDNSDSAAKSTSSVPDMIPPENPDASGLVLALTERAARAEGEAAALREEADRLRDREARERSRAEAAEEAIEEIREEREVARLQAARAEEKAEGLRLALEEARRPFWRRWIG